MKNILVVGGEGTLGSFLQAVSPQVIALSKKEADITSVNSLIKAMQKHKPSYVINCAAITDIAYCEQNPKTCWAVNRDGVKNLTTVVKKFGIKLIHISTDAAVRPVSVYGKSKKEALRFLDKKDLVVTTTFYSKETYILKNLLAGQSVVAYENMYFNPVSILFLATAILQNLDRVGNVRVFSKKKVSKYVFARLAAKVFDKSLRLVEKAHFERKKDTLRKMNSFLRPDIGIDVAKDMLSYKNFLHL